MAAPSSNDERYDTFCQDEDYDDKVKEVLDGFNGGTHQVRIVYGHYACNFCLGRKLHPWSLLDLLNHANGLAARRESIAGPQHKALADYILTSAALADERRRARVGDCGGDAAVQNERARIRVANRAKAERRREAKWVAARCDHGGGSSGAAAAAY